ncbi:EAL domain-containing protein, partial [Acidithiobacillus thiooxidans]
DDVGSAYSSLLRMKELPIDEIKLDQGFVRSLEQRPQDLHFLNTIQDLANGMQVDLVVEGVETEDILDA